MESDDAAYLKVNASGQMVDLRSLSKKDLKTILEYYTKKLKRARNSDIKKACTQCVEQVSEFIYEGKVSGGADIFTLANHLGSKNIISFIKTYFGNTPTQESRLQEILVEEFLRRKIEFPGVSLPPDAVIIRMFFLVVNKQPPLLDEAAQLFSLHYGIESPQITLLERDEYVSSYDLRTNTIAINPSKIDHQLGRLEAILQGLFHHLCREKSWKFHMDEPESNRNKEMEQTDTYIGHLFERCSELGLIPKKK